MIKKIILLTLYFSVSAFYQRIRWMFRMCFQFLFLISFFLLALFVLKLDQWKNSPKPLPVVWTSFAIFYSSTCGCKIKVQILSKSHRLETLSQANRAWQGWLQQTFYSPLILAVHCRETAHEWSNDQYDRTKDSLLTALLLP